MRQAIMYLASSSDGTILRQAHGESPYWAMIRHPNGELANQ